MILKKTFARSPSIARRLTRFAGTMRTASVQLALAALVALSMQVSRAEAQTAAPAAELLSAAQLEQLVAPIALYPDDLLTQVLMAATYPLEVVEAARWVSANPNVSGKPLEDAMAKQSWDPSVKGLAAVPQTLAMMNDKLTWTQQLGDAFLAQQQDVLDAVQRLRQRADAAGNLTSTPQQRVARTSQPGPTGAPAPQIVIERATPDTVYVPIYDPGVVFGAWPYPAYEPFYWSPPGYVASGALGFATGVAVGAALWGNVDWYRRDVSVDVNRFNSFNRAQVTNNAWNHNPRHRGNVPYRDAGTARKFGGTPSSARPAAASVRPDGKAISRQGGDALQTRGAGQAKTAAGKAGGAQKAAAATGAGTKKAAAKGAGTKKTAAAKGAGMQKTAGAPGKARAAGSQVQRAHQPAAHSRAMQPANVGLSRAPHGGMRAGGGRAGGGRGGRR